jgi:hypothetical protein
MLPKLFYFVACFAVTNLCMHVVFFKLRTSVAPFCEKSALRSVQKYLPAKLSNFQLNKRNETFLGALSVFFASLHKSKATKRLLLDKQKRKK